MMQKRQIFTKLFVFIFLVTSFSSCSSSDEPGPEVVTDTFLKKFDGTKWEYVQSWGQTDIFKFNDDELNPIVIWSQYEGMSCFAFFKSHLYHFEIKENTPEKFEIYIEHILGNEIRYYNWSFTINEKDNINLNRHDLIEVDKILVMCPD